MKKILFLIPVSLIICQASQAQTQKGSQMLGVDLGFSSNSFNATNVNSFDNSSSTAKTTVTNFSMGPAYSYFIADKLDLGASLLYNSSAENDAPVNGSFGEKENTTALGATIYLRKYFMFANKFGIRTGPYLSYIVYKDKDVATGDNADAANNLYTRTDNYIGGIDLQFVYFPAQKLGFSATLANLEYDHYKMNQTPSSDKESGNEINFNFINSGLQLSVFYAFGGK